MESNHPAVGLPRPAGFEDRMGHQTPAAPRPMVERRRGRRRKADCRCAIARAVVVRAARRPTGQVGQVGLPLALIVQASLWGGPCLAHALTGSLPRRDTAADDVAVEDVELAARSAGDALLADGDIRSGHPSPPRWGHADTHVARSRLRAVRRAEPHARAAARVRVVQPARADLRAGHRGHSRRLRRRCELDRLPPPPHRTRAFEHCPGRRGHADRDRAQRRALRADGRALRYGQCLRPRRLLGRDAILVHGPPHGPFQRDRSGRGNGSRHGRGLHDGRSRQLAALPGRVCRADRLPPARPAT